MNGAKIELDKALWSRVQEHVRAAGYSSPEEFVQHCIERELAKSESGETDPAKIRGIGYLDAGADI